MGQQVGSDTFITALKSSLNKLMPLFSVLINYPFIYGHIVKSSKSWQLVSTRSTEYPFNTGNPPCNIESFNFLPGPVMWRLLGYVIEDGTWKGEILFII